MAKFLRTGPAVEFEDGVLLHRSSSMVLRGDMVEVRGSVAKQFKRDSANWRPVIDARKASPRRRRRERGGRKQW